MARPRKPWFRSRTNEWCVTIDGTQVPLTKGRQNKAEAEREFHRLMSLRDEDADSQATSGSVVTLLGRFLGWVKKHKSDATYEGLRYYLRSFVRFKGIKTLPPHKVTIPLVERWLDSHPGWKASRRHAILSVLRAFNWAVKRGELNKNPIANIDVPAQKRVTTYLTAEQRTAIFNATKDRAFKNFMTALQETGCRPGEACAVEAKHVDLAAGVWVLPEHKTGNKTGKPRTVYLTRDMVNLTRELMVKNPEGPIFLNYRKRPWNRNAVRCRFRKLRASFPEFGHFSAYSFRRAFVTDALERGVGVAQVAELVGHVGTDMVMRHYNQLQERVKYMREMAEKAAG